MPCCTHTPRTARQLDAGVIFLKMHRAGFSEELAGAGMGWEGCTRNVSNSWSHIVVTDNISRLHCPSSYLAVLVAYF